MQPDSTATPAPSQVALFDAALDYAEHHWPIFPLHSITSAGRCTCGKPDCDSPGKHPRTPHGVRDATCIPDQIVEWWRQWPDSNVGVATGLGSGVVVLDLDVKGGGVDQVAALNLPDTRMARTGGGGLHFYFSSAEAIKATTILPGVHLKGEGGYVVAPPSVHLQGVYSWLTPELALAAFPRHLLNGKLPEPIEPKGTTIIHPDQRQWVSDLLTTECPEGERNTTLTRLAGYFRNVLPEHVALTILRIWNADQCTPPLPDAELVANVRHKYLRYQGLGEAPLAAVPTIWTARTLLEAELPDPTWVIEELLPEGLAILAGRPKRGKSWLALQIALSVTNSLSVLGRRAISGKAVYIALEDSEKRLQKRLRLMRALPTDDLILHTTFPPLDLGGLTKVAELLDEHRPVLFVIDTLSRVIGRQRDQDSNADVTDLLDPVQKLALAYNCVIMLIDHHRKPGMDICDAIDDIMGSTAKTGVADVIWGLYRKSGESAGILKVTGRDVSESEIALVWDGLRFQWRAEGTVQEHMLTTRLNKVADLLEEVGEADHRTIAAHLQLSEDSIEALMAEMLASRRVQRIIVQTGTRGRPRFIYKLPMIIPNEPERP